jgi:hypothetical protein
LLSLAATVILPAATKATGSAGSGNRITQLADLLFGELQFLLHVLTEQDRGALHHARAALSHTLSALRRSALSALAALGEHSRRDCDDRH